MSWKIYALTYWDHDPVINDCKGGAVRAFVKARTPAEALKKLRREQHSARWFRIRSIQDTSMTKAQCQEELNTAVWELLGTFRDKDGLGWSAIHLVQPDWKVAWWFGLMDRVNQKDP